MTQKIKLMSDEDINSLVKQIYDKNPDNHFTIQHTHIVHQTIVDECEKRAFEKIIRIAAFFLEYGNKKGLNRIHVTGWDFDKAMQQYLNEQSLTEPPSVDNVQGFLD